MVENAPEGVRSMLIATDGSDGMEEVYRLAFDMAKNLNAKVFALYVVDLSPFAGLPEDDVLVRAKARLYENGWNVLRSLKEVATQAGIEAEAMVEEGTPSEKIVKIAKKLKVDMIVMGTTGKSGIDKILLGSVAETVIKNAPCPVLAVRKTTS
ncbi:MAG: universal stress protein [Thermoplasmata archaeon]|nr:universal stress protein [Thermoplasmata archaeon]